MAVNELIRGKGCTIKCWAIDESTEALEAGCRAAGITPVNNFTLVARYRQYLVTQLLFAEMFPGEILTYESTGKPVTNSDNYISISHCGDTVVMMKSNTACGVDIERIHSRVEKVKHKFLTDEELARVEAASTEELVRYWTAKEAMFKVYGSEDVFMRSHIFVNNVTSSKAEATLLDGELALSRIIRYCVYSDMILAWTEEHGS
jgi:phosphopantetheinyl transferase